MTVHAKHLADFAGVFAACSSPAGRNFSIKSARPRCSRERTVPPRNPELRRPRHNSSPASRRAQPLRGNAWAMPAPPFASDAMDSLRREIFQWPSSQTERFQHRCFVVTIIFQRRVKPFPPQTLQQEIAGHTHEKSAQSATSRIKSLAVANQDDENFLSDVFGQRARATHLQSKSIDARLSPAVKRSHRLFVSGRHSLEQLGVAVASDLLA